MYISDNPEYETETAMLIEEILKQRILGMKNTAGVYVTPAFPKLLYVTDENNIHKDSKYYYLTELACECVAKRMMPDFISAKIMREQYDGEVFGPMGCVDGKSIIDYKIDNERYVESFERAWQRISNSSNVSLQPNNKDEYIDIENISIWDNKIKDYTKVYRFIRNTQSQWYRITLSGGRLIDVTSDHPFEVENKGVILAKDIKLGDIILKDVAKDMNDKSITEIDKQAWLDGLIICDSCLSNSALSISLGLDEKDIADYAVNILQNNNYKVKVSEKHRGIKGNYIEIYVNKSSKLANDYISLFNGAKKSERCIPQYIFNSSYNTKLSFMAGMIDADGYVNDKTTLRVQLGSTNQELAMQQLALALDLGLNASVYENKYNSSDETKIRYRIEFNCTEQIANYLISSKKRNHFNVNHTFLKNIELNKDTCDVTNIIPYTEEKYSYDVTTESEHFTVNNIYSHNCRSFLGSWKDPKTNKYKWWGRFNKGVVTLNLADVGLSANKDIDNFWKILDERLLLCKQALIVRAERLFNTSTNISPIHWKYGAIARLGDDEPNFNSLLEGGYSSLSLGYAGLYECIMALTGKSHTDESNKELAINIISHLKAKCDEWNKERNLGFSLYGTPLESTTYKFARCLKERFGVIKDITDHDYITNSYHVSVREHISAFDKLLYEAQFQNISTGGAISYVETCNLTNNIDAIMQLVQFMYENIKYAELNGKSDYCHNCGFSGEISLTKDEANDDLVWECPQCHNRDRNKLTIIRRTCGLT